MRKGFRAAAAVLLISALINLTGCTHFWTIGETITVSRVESQVNANQSPYTQITQRGDYDNLPSDDCRALYDAVAEVADGISNEMDDEGKLYQMQPVAVPGSFTAGDIARVVKAYRDDNPDQFWISGSYQYAIGENSAYLQLYSNIDPNMRDTCAALLDSAVAEILQQVPANLSELDREEAVYNLLADRCAYQDDTTTDSGEQDWVPYTAYGALADGRAVCEGYARAMSLLCAKVGLACRVVDGTYNGGGHAWNLVCIDGEWYHFDATGMDADDARNVAYFNVTDAVIAEDHTVDPVDGGENGNFNLPMPAADSTAANYFVARGVHIAALDDDTAHAVAQALADAAAAGKDVLALYIDEGLDFSDTEQKLFQGFPFFFQGCVRRANTALDDGEKLDYTALRYVPLESQRGISVCLN